jgi:DNA-binding CsgD family transcriptional regulator
MHLGLSSGPLLKHLSAAEASLGLLDTASDPYVTTSILDLFSFASFVAGQYRDALAAADRELAIAEEFELPFVIPHAEINRACSLIALRQFAEARRALGVVVRRVRTHSDPYLTSMHAIQAAALEIARGDLNRALEHLASGSHPRTPSGVRGEYYALRALVLTALERHEEAERQNELALARTQELGARALVGAATALRAAILGEAAKCVEAYEEIVASGFTWVLPLAWRARFEVAVVLLESREHRDSVLELLLGANDKAIAKRSGIQVPRVASRRLGLSAREQEVCELLAEGRTNQEIATMLFISLSTTKVHVKHIFEKLAVRSRAEAARLWEDR